jgi:hypothetical protein
MKKQIIYCGQMMCNYIIFLKNDINILKIYNIMETELIFTRVKINVAFKIAVVFDIDIVAAKNIIDAEELTDLSIYTEYLFEVYNLVSENFTLVLNYKLTTDRIESLLMFACDELRRVYIKKQNLVNASKVEVPVVSEPVVTAEPVISEPVASDPVVSEPVVSEPVVSEPVVSEPVVVEPVVVEPSVDGVPVVEELLTKPEEKDHVEQEEHVAKEPVAKLKVVIKKAVKPSPPVESTTGEDEVKLDQKKLVVNKKQPTATAIVRPSSGLINVHSYRSCTEDIRPNEIVAAVYVSDDASMTEVDDLDAAIPYGDDEPLTIDDYRGHCTSKLAIMAEISKQFNRFPPRTDEEREEAKRVFDEFDDLLHQDERDTNECLLVINEDEERESQRVAPVKTNPPPPPPPQIKFNPMYVSQKKPIPRKK